MSISDDFIKCAKCKCKYINDDEHVKLNFGYKDLETRYKTCSKCREKAKIYKDKPIKIYFFEETQHERFIIRYRINNQLKKMVSDIKQ